MEHIKPKPIELSRRFYEFGESKPKHEELAKEYLEHSEHSLIRRSYNTFLDLTRNAALISLRRIVAATSKEELTKEFSGFESIISAANKVFEDNKNLRNSVNKEVKKELYDITQDAYELIYFNLRKSRNFKEMIDLLNDSMGAPILIELERNYIEKSKEDKNQSADISFKDYDLGSVDEHFKNNPNLNLANYIKALSIMESRGQKRNATILLERLYQNDLISPLYFMKKLVDLGLSVNELKTAFEQVPKEDVASIGKLINLGLEKGFNLFNALYQSKLINYDEYGEYTSRMINNYIEYKTKLNESDLEKIANALINLKADRIVDLLDGINVPSELKSRLHLIILNKIFES